MKTPSTLNNLLVLVGPTAVGKTRLAIELAERWPGEIISADSRYLYRGLDIGTAKPTPAERARVPHHLIDVLDPDQVWSVAEQRAAVERLIGEINARGRLPLLVGGTGQYIRAILQGWTIPPHAPDPALRARLETQSPAELYQQLQTVDPVAATQIDPRNARRVIRALEVTLGTGQPFSAQRQKNAPRYATLLIGLTLPRAELYRRVDARIRQMLAAGWVAEVQALLAQGYAESLPAFSAIGYRQLSQHLRGAISLVEAEQLIQRATRQFVRRQANWFKPDDPQIHWHNVETLQLEQLMAEIRAHFHRL